jgi:glycosyltransferase involved in cell wall biosynthesis
MRVLFFTERLAPPFDEGIKNVAVNLLRRLVAEHDVLALTTGGADIPDLRVRNAPALNRALLNAGLRREIRSFRPERICYLPTASMTLFSFLRARILKWHGRGAPVSMIALQPRQQSRLQQRLVSRIAPERVIVQSSSSAARLRYLGSRVHFVPAGVDMARFAPVDDARRRALRRQYGIDDDAHVILHVGHLNLNRNVQILGALARLEGARVLLAGSSSTRQDPALIADLQSAGVEVFTGYHPHIEELYQLADLYVFPSSPATSPDETPAIEAPLSVLEAMACDLPVATTRFGGLPAMFEAGGGVFFVDDPHDAAAWKDAITSGLLAGRGRTRRRVAPHSWQNLLDAALGADIHEQTRLYDG